MLIHHCSIQGIPFCGLDDNIALYFFTVLNYFVFDFFFVRVEFSTCMVSCRLSHDKFQS